jgi:predicted MFS family arabinose efflux permease
MTAASTALLLTAAATTRAEHWQIPVLVTAAGGALFPPLTPALRAIWSRIMPDKERLQSIHSLDSTVEELTFVATPLLGSALMALSGPELSMMVGALLMVPASLGLTSVLRTVPPVDQPKAAHTKASQSHRSIIRSSTGRGIVFPVVALGLCAGGLNVIIPAVATDFGGLVSSGYSFAAFSLGGVVGGRAYGRKKWMSPLSKRYTVAAAALAAGALILALLSHSPLTMLASFCVGLPVTPIFVIAYLLVDERIDPSRHPEANAWLGSGYNLGSASGAALGGQMLTLTGARPVAAALAVVAFGAAAVTHRLRAPAAPTAAREASEPAGLDEAASN